jgi:hypothetical protein
MTTLSTRPYQLLCQLLTYFLTFGGQTESTVRRSLRKLAVIHAVRRDKQGHYS